MGNVVQNPVGRGPASTQSQNIFQSPAGASYPVWTLLANGVPYSSFGSSASTSSLAIANLPAGGILHGIKIQHTQAFTGGSLSAYTISVGDLANPAIYAAAFNVLQAPGPTVFSLSSNFAGENMATPTQLYATATATGDTLNNATSGAVNIWALISVAAP